MGSSSWPDIYLTGFSSGRIAGQMKSVRGAGHVRLSDGQIKRSILNSSDYPEFPDWAVEAGPAQQASLSVGSVLGNLPIQNIRTKLTYKILFLYEANPVTASVQPPPYPLLPTSPHCPVKCASTRLWCDQGGQL